MTVDISAEAVEAMARAMLSLAPDGYADNSGVSARVGGLRTAAATLRALAAERLRMANLIEALTAERAALRAALTGIASQKTSSEFSRNDRRYVNFESGHKDVVQIARAALKGNTP